MIDGYLTLIERVPRWVAERRFRARRRGENGFLSVLFFRPGLLPRLERDGVLDKARHLKAPAWLPPQSSGVFRDIEFLCADWRNGPSLRELLDEERAVAPMWGRGALAHILDALEEAMAHEIPLPAVNAESILMAQTANSDPTSGPGSPVLFPVCVDETTNEESRISSLAVLARALLPRGLGAGRVLDRAARDPGHFGELHNLTLQLRPFLKNIPPRRRREQRFAPREAMTRNSGRSSPEPNGSTKTAPSQPTGPEPPPAAPRNPLTEWIGVTLAAAVAAAVLWFTVFLANQLSEPYTLPIVTPAPTETAPAPADQSPADLMEQALSMERLGNPAGALRIWTPLLNDPDHQTAAREAADRLLRAAAEDLPNIRLGIRPDLVEAIRNAAAAGHQPARDLLVEIEN